MESNNLALFEKKIELSFKDKNLLKEVFTHRSFLNESPQKGMSSNERLEFLGDSILGFWVSKKLFKNYLDLPEGTLTNMRTLLVRRETLAKIGARLLLGENLFLSRGEEKGGGRENKALLANTFEALVGAIFLDQGLTVAENFLKKHFAPLIKDLKSNIDDLKDAKSLLQEKIQTQIKVAPDYLVIEEKGPDHDKVFKIGVYLQGKLMGKGEGKSKQEAEEAAAQDALEKSAEIS